MIADWVLEKLQTLKEEPMLLVQDSLRLLPDADGAVHRFASDHGFTVIIAATNLAFRELFEKATVSKRETKKLLVLDRAPARRRAPASWTKAPPPFYPDVLAKTPAAAQINISLRQFLMEKTGDPDWPREVDDPRFARLISRCLEGVLQAHRGLRAVHPTRFTDHDFKTIVAYAALGVPETAFKRLETKSYWRIALLGYPALAELDALAPEIAQVIRKELGAAAPFCWFADAPPEQVVRAFYLAAILAQHTEHWPLLLPSIDPDLRAFSRMETALIREAAPELTAMDPGRAHTDLQELEASLSTENL